MVKQSNNYDKKSFHANGFIDLTNSRFRVSRLNYNKDHGKKANLSFNVTKAKKLIDGYSSIKKLTEREKNSLKTLCQGAAIRFLLTRVFDYLNSTKGALVKIKDPVEYLKRLEFHNSVKNYQDYFF